MEEYYTAFKEKSFNHEESQFDVESFKSACPGIYYQIGTRDWGPFTIPVDPYFLELVWEFYTSYRARKRLLKHKGLTKTLSCLTLVWVRGQEVPVTPEAINSLYWEEPIHSHPIFCKKVEDKANQFQWVSNLIAKGQPKLSTSTGLIHRRDLKFDARFLLDLDFVSQLVQLAKAITSMIQLAFKKVLHPAKDKLTSLCSTVDVLEREVGTLRQEVSALSAPPSTGHPTPHEPEVMPAQPEAPRSPPDDWWVGYDSD
ncbi:hypothetical protein HAX54_044559 [Datura stramonium]|uniref:Putative plant transposon protein domain-containing protein n=1 Tax=Datura stramonium TaxID=4076 RepID=A0ABS8WER3_DATST|nr:hypothetical protein [Datura stramonium]